MERLKGGTHDTHTREKIDKKEGNSFGIPRYSNMMRWPFCSSFAYVRIIDSYYFSNVSRK